MKLFYMFFFNKNYIGKQKPHIRDHAVLSCGALLD